MTRKKEKKENPSNEALLEEEVEVVTDDSKEDASKAQDDLQAKIEVQDIKLIEGKEQKVLEYYSKDNLIEQIKTLEEGNKKKNEQLLKYQTESDDWKNKYMRLQAEFENAQKRWNKNRQNLRIEYTASALKTFLPLYDSFKKALENSDENQVILKGFYDQFINILKYHKAIPIDVKVNDTFDYNYHEALSSIERDDLPNNTIINIIQDGWKLDKEVIRYTKVIVSRVPPPPEPEPKPEPKPEAKAELEEEITQDNKESEAISIENENENEKQQETEKASKETIEPKE
jgi:molecular chaperone GrpE